MNCPECDGKIMQQVGIGEFTTLLGFGNGPCGRQHDDNCRKREYQCENGYRFVLSRINSCSCGWSGRESCFCHPGKKVTEWPSFEPVEDWGA